MNIQKTSVFSDLQKIINYTLIVVWVLVFVDFCIWWFGYNTVENIYGFIAVSLSVMWLPLLHAYFFFFSLRQKDFAETNIVITPSRLALITTKIPNESDELLIRTLVAMKAQKIDFAYDTWLLDEDPQPSMIQWCKDNGVYISTRKHNDNYHRSTYPGKAKTKEGNIRYFLDHWGYQRYDFLIQFDADHAPEPDFAYEVMKEFQDPEVGYVATPSIVDGNISESWTVKARNYWEATTHGPMQSGAHGEFAPMMFGSHYSHRMIALKEIGGIGPEIAEDHTTTLLYNAHGWKGGFARNAIAHGYGAVGIVDSMMQEYQWAMVGMRAALLITPRFFRHLKKGVMFQFLVWELWYPLLTLISLISLIIPLYAVFSGDPIVKVEGEGFWFRYLWLNGIFLLFGSWLRYLQHLRPKYSWNLSFETFIFQYLQFPWIVIGWLQGMWQVITKQQPGKIVITDKDNNIKDVPLKYLLPHIVIILITWIPLIWYQKSGEASGYILFVLLLLLSYLVSVICGVYLSIEESLVKIRRGEKWEYIRTNLYTIVCVILISLISAFLVGKAFDEYFHVQVTQALSL